MLRFEGRRRPGLAMRLGFPAPGLVASLRDTPTPGALILHPVGARCPMIIPTAHQLHKARILSQLAFLLAFNCSPTPQPFPQLARNPTPAYLPNLTFDLTFSQ